MNPNESAAPGAVNTASDSGADLSGGAPGRDIGNDGRPRTVAAALAANARQDDGAARQAKADAEGQDTAEDVLRAFVTAAHDSPGGAAFSECVRRAAPFIGDHRVIPEPAPVDDETARRVLASTDNAADLLTAREDATRAALAAADAPPPAPPAPELDPDLS